MKRPSPLITGREVPDGINKPVMVAPVMGSVPCTQGYGAWNGYEFSNSPWQRS